MRQLTELEQDNVSFLMAKGIPFAIVHLTQNILNHSIFDATSDMRRMLRGSGVHDFSSQTKGSDNKVFIPTHILTFARDIETQTSLYRSTTRGDERMWPGGAILKLTKDNDIIAVLAFEKELYVINISQIDIEMSVRTFLDNPIKKFFRQ